MRNTPEPAYTAPSAVSESEGMMLARLAARGDEVATTRLLRMMAPRARAVVRAIMGAHHPDCDDALQLTLIGFVKALPAFRGDCDPAGYVSTIAVRTAVAARRRARTRESRLAEVEDVSDGGEALGADPAAAQRQKEILRELLGQIPPEQAETLAMRVVLGWSLEEIATYMQAPVNTVRSRLRLAKEAMRRRIEADAALLEELEVEP
jgi:RNA polymerase sigma-70 factor (ECF subfamily)